MAKLNCSVRRHHGISFHHSITLDVSISSSVRSSFASRYTFWLSHSNKMVFGRFENWLMTSDASNDAQMNQANEATNDLIRDCRSCYDCAPKCHSFSSCQNRRKMKIVIGNRHRTKPQWNRKLYARVWECRGSRQPNDNKWIQINIK